jgi:hypothetical protein
VALAVASVAVSPYGLGNDSPKKHLCQLVMSDELEAIKAFRDYLAGHHIHKCCLRQLHLDGIGKPSHTAYTGYQSADRSLMSNIENSI